MNEKQTRAVMEIVRLLAAALAGFFGGGANAL